MSFSSHHYLRANWKNRIFRASTNGHQQNRGQHSCRAWMPAVALDACLACGHAALAWDCIRVVRCASVAAHQPHQQQQHGKCNTSCETACLARDGYRTCHRMCNPHKGYRHESRHCAHREVQIGKTTP